MHAPEEKVKEFTILVEQESTPAEEPSPVIDQSEGCSYKEEELERKEEERSRRKAARAIYLGAAITMDGNTKDGQASSLWSTSQGE